MISLYHSELSMVWYQFGYWMFTLLDNGGRYERPLLATIDKKAGKRSVNNLLKSDV